ncbi:bifunctional adenosylcobinamide kinase/adenosylcobinamide-phosphate guanylyltransferase [Alteromonas sp. C1M14]|uniref:bifunctional adenosylcobinamide kinase/adenosylcobinamide-phosphate guanylyltransferase n=1 Tax=Alteromonas sp. C1M14 TaxID=2841567 RepID=UPI001C088B71|nr:bifunctional adenosylcobinamide kinase/adenosylcobinamide-phosphate guanylyltransferase [Alteromonas sp. C1M14]MBU2979620.1 bifunctional adenosylcobinamide kinase/adenosylcobinamide-phosphate guanylyltransferase [Alteromonas sp. C1M14]
MIHFILGGARSGKSRYAQQWVSERCQQTQQDVTYIATATVTDAQMEKRIQRHQQDRPAHWKLIEAPYTLPQAVATHNNDDIILIDCLTLWLNNLLFKHPQQDFDAVFSQLTTALKSRTGTTVVVSNEVGLGIIPMGEVSRQFVDQAGWLNQAMAATADKVTFVAAGLPLTLKPQPSL